MHGGRVPSGGISGMHKSPRKIRCKSESADSGRRSPAYHQITIRKIAKRKALRAAGEYQPDIKLKALRAAGEYQPDIKRKAAAAAEKIANIRYCNNDLSLETIVDTIDEFRPNGKRYIKRKAAAATEKIANIRCCNSDLSLETIVDTIDEFRPNGERYKSATPSDSPAVDYPQFAHLQDQLRADDYLNEETVKRHVAHKERPIDCDMAVQGTRVAAIMLDNMVGLDPGRDLKTRVTMCSQGTGAADTTHNTFSKTETFKPFCHELCGISAIWSTHQFVGYHVGAHIARHPDGYSTSNKRARVQVWYPVTADAKSTLCFGYCEKCNNRSCTHSEADLTCLYEVVRTASPCITVVDMIGSGAAHFLAPEKRNRLMHWTSTKEGSNAGRSVTLNLAAHGSDSAQEQLDLLMTSKFCM